MPTTKNKIFTKFLKNFRKTLQVSLIHPTKIFSKNFTNFTPLTKPNSQKKYKSLPTTRNKFFEKFYKFSKRITKKGQAWFVTGGGDAPPVTSQAFSLLLALTASHVLFPGLSHSSPQLWYNNHDWGL